MEAGRTDLPPPRRLAWASEGTVSEAIARAITEAVARYEVFTQCFQSWLSYTGRHGVAGQADLAAAGLLHAFDAYGVGVEVSKTPDEHCLLAGPGSARPVVVMRLSAATPL